MLWAKGAKPAEFAIRPAAGESRYFNWWGQHEGGAGRDWAWPGIPAPPLLRFADVVAALVMVCVRARCVGLQHLYSSVPRAPSATQRASRPAHPRRPHRTSHSSSRGYSALI